MKVQSHGSAGKLGRSHGEPEIYNNNKKINVFSYTTYKINKISRRDQNTIVTRTREVVGRDVYAEKRLIAWCPYKYNSGRFPRI